MNRPFAVRGSPYLAEPRPRTQSKSKIVYPPLWKSTTKRPAQKAVHLSSPSLSLPVLVKSRVRSYHRIGARNRSSRKGCLEGAPTPAQRPPLTGQLRQDRPRVVERSTSSQTAATMKRLLSLAVRRHVRTTPRGALHPSSVLYLSADVSNVWTIPSESDPPSMPRYPALTLSSLVIISSFDSENDTDDDLSEMYPGRIPMLAASPNRSRRCLRAR